MSLPLCLYIEKEQENTIIKPFQELSLSNEMLRSLNRMGFSDPTPVQDAAIGPALEKRDLLVQAPTGTGKTCAFGIPTVEGIDPENRNIQTIILCPTRELALQTTAVLRELTIYKPGIGILALYGGESIQHQIKALHRRPQVIVATPGRMMDHIRRRTTKLHDVKLVVLDEADRMLDMGFRDDMNVILESVPNDRQTVLFSATLSSEIKRIANEYQRDAENIHIKQETLTVERVEQFYSIVRRGGKTPALLSLLKEKQFDLSLIFVATKAMADQLAQQLNQNGFTADALHGDLRQRQRDIVMKRYRTGKVNILVATDVAARGIDVTNIDAVINYDIPIESESYVHRIGRTGRAGQGGVAYTFVYPHENYQLKKIMSDTKAAILPVTIGSETVTADPQPKEYRKKNHFSKSKTASANPYHSDKPKFYAAKNKTKRNWKSGPSKRKNHA